MGNQQILEVCITRNKDELDTSGKGKTIRQRSPQYRKIVQEQAHPNAKPLAAQFSTMPFSRTHFATFKKMVDSLNAERFSID